MKLANEKNHSCGCEDEYSTLQKVIVSSPQHMKITEIINETQKHFADENIDIPKAIQQHEQFVAVLEDNGVEVVHIEALPRLNEQVFTRDIGFCIGERVYVSSLASPIRREEVQPLVEYLKDEEIPYTRLYDPHIEGGDVLVDGHRLWVGLSNRTEERAISYLNKMLPDYEIIPLPLKDDILHLDCAFNILSSTEAVIYPEAFNKQDVERLSKEFSLIPVSTEEQFTMGTNVLSIGNRKVISLPQNKEINEKLMENGFHVIEADLSEIIKSGGSFRCCTLPLNRQD
ncbi:arginine deiminase family protein [Halobacillus salinarum]|uniref:Arginine deiminase family protein n=1 Tax=Halobacillus salinarum TaxID=2932257 RepID=A0ABY4ELL5_9BACI|nr:arginine deiminase family protein [Halobacillus salinarum]UOQ45336.1 arginine deiminase family protein [Halobacillus salinarum]